MNVMRQSASQFASVLNSAASEPIVIAGREVPASIGETLAEDQDATGLVITTRYQDFLVRSADLPQLPQRGDLVTYNGSTYTVMGAGSNGPVVEPVDSYGVLVRIHTLKGRVA